MVKPSPYFLDADGATIRVDPAPGQLGYIGLTITTPTVFDDMGHEVTPPRTLHVYLNRRAGAELSNILHVVSDPELGKIIGQL